MKTSKNLAAVKTITLVVGETYWMGAMSDPAQIMITAVEADRIAYTQCDRAAVVPRWMGEDLIRRGCETKRANIAKFLATPFGQKIDRDGAWNREGDRLSAILV